jgi:hypothetical protein
MNRTGTQVLADVYQYIKGSTLAEMVSGGVYYAETRPRDSKAEDIVIGYLAGVPADLQQIVVNINIFVPDIDPWQNGVLAPDIARIATIETAAAEWSHSLTVGTTDGKYQVSLYDNIHSGEATGIGQHYVNVQLRFRYWSNYE